MRTRSLRFSTDARKLWLCGLAGFGLIAVASSAHAAASTREVAESVHERGAYPNALPLGAQPPKVVFEGAGNAASGSGSKPAEKSEPNEESRHEGTATSEEQRDLEERRARRDTRRSETDGSEPLAPRPERSASSGGHGTTLRVSGFDAIAIALLVAVVAACTALLIWLASRRGASGPQPALAANDEPSDQTGETTAASPRSDYETLARAGRYDEALRAALVQALLAVGWRPEARGVSATAREIVAALPVAHPARETLAWLVHHVEAVHFGGTLATRELFDEVMSRVAGLARQAPQA
jgi:hypothetical protein